MGVLATVVWPHLAAAHGALVAYIGGYRYGRGMYGLGFVGVLLIGAGFKVWRDHCDINIPAELRPSAWSAVAAWVIGALFVFGTVALYNLRY